MCIKYECNLRIIHINLTVAMQETQYHSASLPLAMDRQEHLLPALP